jgi:hypothetical protein
MSDIITGMRQVIQDLVAPDLKAQGAKLETLQKQSDILLKHMEMQHDAAMKTIDAFRAEMRSEFASLPANHQIEIMRQISPLSERVATLEAHIRRA